jgi:hypothetical protein
MINWNHPLSRGLQGCFLFNEGGGATCYNLVNLDITRKIYKPYVIGTNLSRSYDEKGPCLSAPTTATVITNTSDTKFYHGTSPYTCYCGLKLKYTPLNVNWNTIWARYYNNYDYSYSISQGKPFISVGGGTDYNTTTATLTAYKYHQVGYQGISGSGTTHYIDGVADRNVGSNVDDYPIVCFGGTTFDFSTLRGNLYFIYFWGKSLIPMKEINKNPYQFITPNKFRKIFLAAPTKMADMGQMGITINSEYPTYFNYNAPTLGDQVNSFSFSNDGSDILSSLASDDTNSFEVFPEGAAFPLLLQTELSPRPIITVSSATIWELASAISASSTAGSDLTAALALISSILGTSDVSVQVNALQLLAGAITGTAAVDATILSAKELLAAITASGSIEASLVALQELQSAIAGLSAIAPAASAINFVTSAVAASSAISPTATAINQVASGVTGTSAVSPTATAINQVLTGITGLSAVAPTASAINLVTSNIAGSSAAAASFDLVTFLLSDITGTAAVSVTATVYGNLNSDVAGSCNVVPALKLDASLTCNTNGTCSVGGGLNSLQLLTSAINAGAAISVTLTGSNDLGTDITGSTNVGITLKLDSALLSSILASGLVTAEAALYKALVAAIDGLSATELSDLAVSTSQLLQAIINGTVAVEGTLKMDVGIAAIVNGSAQLSTLLKQLLLLEASITGLSNVNIITRFVLLKALISGTSNVDLKRFLSFSSYAKPLTNMQFLRADDHHKPYN